MKVVVIFKKTKKVSKYTYFNRNWGGIIFPHFCDEGKWDTIDNLPVKTFLRLYIILIFYALHIRKLVESYASYLQTGETQF